MREKKMVKDEKTNGKCHYVLNTVYMKTLKSIPFFREINKCKTLREYRKYYKI